MRIFAVSFASIALATAPGNQATASPYFPPALERSSITCRYGGRSWQEPVLSDLQIAWYSGMLAAAREPSLYRIAQSKPAHTILRFTWLRSFDAPVVVRVEWKGFSGRLYAKQLSAAGGYGSGNIVKTINRNLGLWDTIGLRHILWKTQLLKSPATGCLAGLDGAQWIIEGVDETGYHFLDRWSPESGNVREAGLFLIKMTGWTFKDVD